MSRETMAWFGDIALTVRGATVSEESASNMPHDGDLVVMEERYPSGAIVKLATIRWFEREGFAHEWRDDLEEEALQ